MKRLRDDGSSSQSGSLSGDSDRQSQVSASGLGDNSRELTIDDGKTFLKEVEETFQDQREKYYRFIKVLIDFKHRRINTTDVLARAKELFEGHNNLISGFNIFLPKGKEIHLTNQKEN
ncbi:paired amphipathic helix protein sin3-like 1 [Quercus suber]|uniref:Paired amphipathic helix protein sin3-like 1 n=1 Tax=Quercus suber TaxID=58331 RepID=A0AAW0MBX4_QUESU